jgi:hypothetical protein
MQKALIHSGLNTSAVQIKKIQKTMETVSLKVVEDDNDEHGEGKKKGEAKEETEYN